MDQESYNIVHLKSIFKQLEIGGQTYYLQKKFTRNDRGVSSERSTNSNDGRNQINSKGREEDKSQIPIRNRSSSNATTSTNLALSNTKHSSIISNVLKNKFPIYSISDLFPSIVAILEKSFNNEYALMVDEILDPIHLLLVSFQYYMESPIHLLKYSTSKEHWEFIRKQINIQFSFSQYNKNPLNSINETNGFQTLNESLHTKSTIPLHQLSDYSKRFLESEYNLFDKFSRFTFSFNTINEHINTKEEKYSTFEKIQNNTESNQIEQYNIASRLNNQNNENSIQDISNETFDLEKISLLLKKLQETQISIPFVELDHSKIQDYFTPLNFRNLDSENNIEERQTIEKFIDYFWKIPILIKLRNHLFDNEVASHLLNQSIRILHQVSMILNQPHDQDFSLHEIYIEMILIQTIQILSNICASYPQNIFQVATQLKRLFQQLITQDSMMLFSSFHIIELLDFFLRHAHTKSYDLESIVKQFFQEAFPKCIKYDSKFSYFMSILIERRSLVFKERDFFTRYKWQLFTIAELWIDKEIGFSRNHDDNGIQIEIEDYAIISPLVNRCLNSLLPNLIHHSEMIDIFHLILDHPILYLSRYRQYWNNPVLDYYTNGRIWNDQFDGGDWFLIQKINFDFMKENSNYRHGITKRFNGVILMLNIFFESIFNNSSIESADILQLFKIILKRLEYQYLEIPEALNIIGNIKSTLLQNISKFLQKWNNLVFDSQSELLHQLRIGSDKTVVFLSSSIGETLLNCEFSSFSQMNSFYEPLEVITFEKLAYIRASQSEQSSIVNIENSIQLLNSLATCLSKLGAREPDLIPRVIVCLGNILKNAFILHPSTVQLLTLHLQLLKTPNLARTLFKKSNNLNENNLPDVVIIK